MCPQNLQANTTYFYRPQPKDSFSSALYNFKTAPSGNTWQSKLLLVADPTLQLGASSALFKDIESHSFTALLVNPPHRYMFILQYDRMCINSKETYFLFQYNHGLFNPFNCSTFMKGRLAKMYIMIMHKSSWNNPKRNYIYIFFKPRCPT